LRVARLVEHREAMNAKHLLVALFTLTTAAGSALADGLLYSTQQTDYAITYTEPSGKISDATLYKGTDVLGYLAIPAKPGKPTPIVIKDQDGTVLARGTVVDNRSYVLLGEDRGLRIVPAGLVAQIAPVSYPGTAIVSALPGAYTIDLFGDTGQGGVKGVRPVTAFDIKAATKLPVSDNRYKASIRLPEGSTLKGLSSVDAGMYYVLHKTYDGKVTVSSAGHMK
jgi:hypothetical protein